MREENAGMLDPATRNDHDQLASIRVSFVA
jgi:hypothetical protein